MLELPPTLLLDLVFVTPSVQLKTSHLKPRTIENYESYLRPFINWLDEPQQASSTVVNNQLVKRYLDIRFRKRSYLTYQRTGAQIIYFLNRFLDTEIKLIKSVGHNRDFDNVQMPAEHMTKLNTILDEKLDSLHRAKPSILISKQISKVLGKYLIKNVTASNGYFF